MEKYSRENLRNIQNIVQAKTGVDLTRNSKPARYKIRQTAILACCFMCFVSLSAFAYAKFSGLNGDEAGFAAVYQGNGQFAVVVENYSDVELTLQNKVRLMQWSTGREAAGDSGKIKLTGESIAPHSQGVIMIDISEGYDIAAMQANLADDDWYYFVLTNNNFVFGQDWQCAFDFEVEDVAAAAARLAWVRAQNDAGPDNPEQPLVAAEPSLLYSDWLWPTVSRRVSGLYGEQQNGSFADHINIAGTNGDDVYAVAGGVVTETGFESACGNYICLDLGGGVAVKYGHLAEIKAAAGAEVKQGQIVGTLGKTGMATGPNLLFAVSVNGASVNPLAENSGE